MSLVPVGPHLFIIIIITLNLSIPVRWR